MDGKVNIVFLYEGGDIQPYHEFLIASIRKTNRHARIFKGDRKKWMADYYNKFLL